MRIGSRVVLKDLAKSPALNGCEGTVISPDELVDGCVRQVVRIDSGSVVRVKVCNMEVQSGESEVPLPDVVTADMLYHQGHFSAALSAVRGVKSKKTVSLRKRVKQTQRQVLAAVSKHPLHVDIQRAANTAMQGITAGMFGVFSAEGHDRSTAWDALRQALVQCPPLVLQRLVEPNDDSVIRPTLVKLAEVVQLPISTDNDSKACADIEKALLGPNDPYEEYDSYMSLYDTSKRLEEQCDRRSARWFLAYAQLDAQRWDDALATVTDILHDIVSGHHVLQYLPEALYMQMVASFANGDGYTDRVTGCVDAYMEVATERDRNMPDAKLMRLWAQHTRGLSESAAQGVMTDMRALLGVQSQTPHHPHLFSDRSWVRSRVTAALGIQEKNQYAELTEMVKRTWDKAGGVEVARRRIPDFEATMARMAESLMCSVTVRYRMPAEEKRKIDRESRYYQEDDDYY
ncbi:hypothetical protein KIPB_007289 [Kipferlia bialata]|uniref:Uncharacterized protein n=1 Tax=Kipferlia bialata TaxID=797122 RepID=A0A9K3CZU0_9EUKA|nr:hypothetical protein KIPB_007289 [Kipferlia bialata]|eukprot:g7289.t1